MEDETSNLNTIDAMQSAQQASGESAAQMAPTIPAQSEPTDGVQFGVVSCGGFVLF